MFSISGTFEDLTLLHFEVLCSNRHIEAITRQWRRQFAVIASVNKAYCFKSYDNVETFLYVPSGEFAKCSNSFTSYEIYSSFVRSIL